ncbi:MAG TPA: D-alanyl-D-alanine carboxypeptidase [Candidatus Pelethocola excrementipullorum]|nr:D-alanyl-D-alanine carboxypeptidase [Candidatus Pelethocola excrementipullorum]
MCLKEAMKRAAAVILTVLVTGYSAISSYGAVVNNDNICTIESNSWKDWPQAVDIGASTGVVMDAETGTILFDKGMDDIRYPASITKIMTTLVALENSTLDTPVVFTETGMADAYSGSSNILPQLGESFTMEQSLYMILLKSANDVSTQVAEVVGGSVQGFVDLMNQKAAELGCINTHFNNASGLPDENHYTTAHDMALIAQAALKNEEFRKIVATSDYTIPPTNMTAGSREYRNHHAMMHQEDTTWYYEGCIGGKTGYTDSALNTLVTYAERDGMKLISVVMHGESGPSVCEDTKAILDYAYTNFKCDDAGEVVTAAGQHIVENQVLSDEEYQQQQEKDEVSDVDEPKVTDTPTPEKKDERVSRGNSLFTYVAIGVLGALVLIGILAIVVSLIKRNRKG